jgi:type II secretory pathway predicted ATPase ExeA
MQHGPTRTRLVRLRELVGASLRTLRRWRAWWQEVTVVLAGDARLPDRFRTPELLPIGSRIRARLALDYASRDELRACLDHLLAAAGNPTLMTPELLSTLCEHAAGNHRVLMTLAGELLAAAAQRELSKLDEKLYFDVFTPDRRPDEVRAHKNRRSA